MKNLEFWVDVGGQRESVASYPQLAKKLASICIDSAKTDTAPNTVLLTVLNSLDGLSEYGYGATAWTELADGSLVSLSVAQLKVGFEGENAYLYSQDEPDKSYGVTTREYAFLWNCAEVVLVNSM